MKLFVRANTIWCRWCGNPIPIDSDAWGADNWACKSQECVFRWLPVGE